MDKRLQSPKVEHYNRFEQESEVPRTEEIVTESAFLDLLDRDITCNSEILQQLPEDLFHQGENLTKGMKTDLDEELPEDFIFVRKSTDGHFWLTLLFSNNITS